MGVATCAAEPETGDRSLGPDYILGLSSRVTARAPVRLDYLAPPLGSGRKAQCRELAKAPPFRRSPRVKAQSASGPIRDRASRIAVERSQ